MRVDEIAEPRVLRRIVNRADAVVAHFPQRATDLLVPEFPRGCDGGDRCLHAGIRKNCRDWKELSVLQQPAPGAHSHVAHRGRGPEPRVVERAARAFQRVEHEDLGKDGWRPEPLAFREGVVECVEPAYRCRGEVCPAPDSGDHADHQLLGLLVLACLSMGYRPPAQAVAVTVTTAPSLRWGHLR